MQRLYISIVKNDIFPPILIPLIVTMSQKNETVTLILALGIAAGILAIGFWWFTRKSDVNLDAKSDNNNPATNVTENNFPPPTNVPSGTVVNIEGSTSMVQINQALKIAFERKFPGTTVNTQSGGTEKGIQSLIAGTVDIAAISRPLNAQEQSQGLVAVPVTKDAIAIVVGDQNSLGSKGLTQTQIVVIFQGKITDWAQVGGKPGTIQVINRPVFSGTHQAFQSKVLGGQNFGTTPNIITWPKDETTAVLQQLKTDGISYATFAQVANQQTVRIVAVDGLTPQSANYPYQRELSYVYKQPATPQVQAFLGYVSSPEGQSAIAEGVK
ncbi:phosphate ABC transporter substrate-binding protein [Symplocastrum sp. BBK-W-15]|uniref:Phosphate ABC transporter substrate-binding protein n=2 Tax=Limnofasciculus TaxID=3064905 RepID=A0AAE3KKD5_9CYAN|nr:substrate-binding domain-containing protein [Limnofasciculus baicalensis]MCP2726944.1 phosphate ABC transporter substrate-binding protein [Limnofasciculus baicalensis BBK-W-15]